MVNQNCLLTIVRILQLIAVMGVCFNHWSVTILKGNSPIFSNELYKETAHLGLIFLFVSSGFISQLTFSRLSELADKRNLRLDFVVGRYIRLLLPAITAITLDYWLIGFADQSQTKDIIRLVPFLLTLTQTWHYSILGTTSLFGSAGGSDMVWFGANLFFLAVCFGFTSNIWSRIKSSTVICILLGASVVLFVLYKKVIYTFSPQINAWAAEHYGADFKKVFELSVWLVERCPLVNLSTFISGILIARLLQIAPPRLLSIIFLGGLVFGILVSSDVAYLGWSIALLIFVARWIESYVVADSRYGRLLDPAGLLSRIGASAYEIYCLHFVIYLGFILAVTPTISAYGVFLLGGRVLVVNCLMLLLCFGFAELYTARWQERVASIFSFKYSGNLRYV